LRNVEANVAKVVVTYLLEKIRYRLGWFEGLGREFAGSLRNLFKSEFAIGID
jgi:hypothetical protein